MIKSLVQGFLRLFGVRLSRLPTKEDELKKTIWLRNMGIKTVLDIGGNVGSFAEWSFQNLPEASVYSFEPLRECYQEIINKFEQKPKFKAYNLALGDETGQVEMYRNEYSPSSSLLPMAKLHKDCFPYTEREEIEKINVVRLDDIAQQLKLDKPLLIKVDVQGFEDKVIMGGIKVFSQADVLMIEMSVEELYKGQLLFDDIYKILVKLGFQYRGITDQLYNPQDGRILQAEVIFRKSSFAFQEIE